MSHVGEQDGAATLSEMHEREVRAFNAQMEHQNAIATALMSEAGRGFAKAKVYEAIAYLIQVSTIIGGIAGVRAVIKWW